MRNIIPYCEHCGAIAYQGSYRTQNAGTEYEVTSYYRECDRCASMNNDDVFENEVTAEIKERNMTAVKSANRNVRPVAALVEHMESKEHPCSVQFVVDWSVKAFYTEETCPESLTTITSIYVEKTAVAQNTIITLVHQANDTLYQFNLTFKAQTLTDISSELFAFGIVTVAPDALVQVETNDGNVCKFFVTRLLTEAKGLTGKLGTVNGLIPYLNNLLDENDSVYQTLIEIKGMRSRKLN